MKDKTQKNPNPKAVSTWYLLLYMLPIGVALVGAIFVRRLYPPIVYYILILSAFVALMIWTHRNWRCPDCGKSLGKVTITDEVTCPHCGKKHKL